MTKALIISDVNKKSQRIKSIIQKKIKNNPPKKNNIVIVVGGDGFMLKTLKKNIAKSKLRGKDKIVRYIDLELPKTISPGGEFRVSCHQYKDGKIHLFVIINSTE